MNHPSAPRASETKMTGQGAGTGHRARTGPGTRVLWRALAGAAVVLMALLGGSVGAQAHDEVEGTAPANGSTVANAPAQVTITLSNTPAVIGSQVNVLDAAGTNWSQGGVQVLDNVATQALKAGAPAGKYTVKWRLVSSDSHPIEGDFTFTATAAAGGGGAVAGPVQSVQQAVAPVPEQASSGGAPWGIGVLVAALVVIVVALVVMAKRRLGAED
ncbi:MAG: copper resistance CopC family protein [Specibacter sp.]